MTTYRSLIAGFVMLVTVAATMGAAGAQQNRPAWSGWPVIQAQALQAEQTQAQAPAAPSEAPEAEPPAPVAVAASDAPSTPPTSIPTSSNPSTSSGPAVLEAPRFQPGEYVLGVGDRLRIIVFGEEDLSGEFVVDSTGRVSFPLIGEIPAALSSVSEFQARVETALRDGYLNDPRVSAEVLNFRPFYILGEVQQPGEYPFTNGLTVLNAVATAGGFTPLANQTRVFIKPAGEGMEEEIVLSPATPVAPGDTIRIAKGAFYILGEVTRPGEYPFSEGMTVLNAVATAGGFTYRANQNRVFIQREGADEEQALRLQPNLRIEAGDTIRIGERFF